MRALSQSNQDHTKVPPPEFMPEKVEVRRDLLAVLLSNTRAALAGNAVVGGLTTTVLSLQVQRYQTPMLIWLAALLALLAARAWQARHAVAHLSTAPLATVQQLETQATVLIGACGLLWGLLPLMGFAGTYGFVDFYIMATLLGMSAGAINSTLALPRALGIYLLAMGLPFIAVRAFAGGAMDWGGALTILITMGFLWATARSAYRNLRANLSMTRQNRLIAQALEQERDALRQIMEAKDLFHAGVTHDLRQPVHAIALHLRYLRRQAGVGLDRVALEQNCTAMETALHAMSRQLTRLLDLSRLESGELRAELGDVAVDQLFRECSAKFAAVASGKGLRWHLRGVEAIVRSDRQMLQSIIDNLVSNAVRFTAQGGVLLGARRRGASLQIYVADTGPGIAPEVIPQLFEAYRRFDDRRAGAHDGYGLGLAMVAKQVEVLGHTLRVRSRPGRGSVFSVTMPAQAHATE